MDRRNTRHLTDKRTKQQKQDAFLAAFSELASISKAVKKAKISRDVVYDWRDKDKAFVKKFDKARMKAAEALEDEAIRRAMYGTKKPVFHKGYECGEITEYSDTLMVLLLKAHAPEKFKERVAQEVTGKNGKPLEIKSNVDYTKLPTEVLEAIVAARIKAED